MNEAPLDAKMEDLMYRNSDGAVPQDGRPQEGDAPTREEELRQKVETLRARQETLLLV